MFAGILSTVRRFGVERVQDRARDLGSLGGGGVFQAHRDKDLFAQERVQRFLADFCQDLAEYHEVGVRVAPVRSRSELHGAAERVLEPLLESPDVNGFALQAASHAGSVSKSG